MTYTKKITKRVGALAMAMIMVFALAINASAADGYNVTLYKSNGTDVSMADDIIASDAVVTTTSTGYRIDITIKPVEDYKAMAILPAADGYLTDLTVSGATAYVTYDSVPYSTATLTIEVEGEVPTGTVQYTVTSSAIQLYYANTSTAYTLVSHISPEFIISIAF